MRKFKILLKGSAVLLISSAVFLLQQFSLLPGQFTMLEGEAHSLPAFFTPYGAEDGFLFEKNGNKAFLTPQKTGAYNVDFSVFGLLRKTATIQVVDPQAVILGGETVGIKLYMQGVIVVAMSEIPGERRICPGKEAGIRTGDRILKLNHEPLSGTDALDRAVKESGGAPITLTVSRDGKIQDTVITPVYYGDGGSYKIGLWVKESAQGVGTVTFCQPETGVYGALGHAIEDFETGGVLEPAGGSITDCSIAFITKSEPGAPGEICGVFGKDTLGTISKNTHLGLYGKRESLPSAPRIPIGVSTQVEKGSATVYTDIAGGAPVGYAAEIQEIFPHKKDSNKNMVIRITDERLLSLSGGIVQGMSGSPIVQNGKLIGAVTHVFVNDPTRGYGVFIENMLAAAEGAE
ncbi:MAG: SpoIVB peptidase [Clostridia bacterium]|nr:SpoIVB peptidase [Clostridia bacterium]